MGLLDGLLGSGQSQQQLQGFVNQYEQGQPQDGYSGQDVLNHYNNVAPHVSNNEYVHAAEQAFGRMSPQQRAEFGQFLQSQAGQHGVDLNNVGQQQLNTNNYQNNPGLLAQMAGMFHSQNPGLLPSLLSGVLGGGSAGALGSMVSGMMGSGQHNTNSGGGMGGMLGNVVEGAMGGGQHDANNSGGVGGLLSNPTAKAALAGIAAMAVKNAFGSHNSQGGNRG